MPHTSPKEITIAGITVSAYTRADGAWMVSDKEAAVLLGLAHVRKHVARLETQNSNKSLWSDTFGKRHWTQAGIIELAQLSRTSKAKAILEEFNVLPRHRTRIESEIVDVLLSAFRDLTPVSIQHSFGPYRVDLYFPLLNLAVEIDENGHGGYSQNREFIRQFLLERSQNIHFIRFNPHDPGKNVGDLINSIFLLLQSAED